MAMIFVPLPRRVGPTARPPFLRPRRWHRQRLRRHATGRAAPVRRRVGVEPVPACPPAPIAGSVDGRSGTADTWPAAPATALLFPAPTARRSTPLACRARVDRGHRGAVSALRLAPAASIAHR